MIVIVYNLGAGLYYMMTDKGQTDRTVKALTWRIGLSVLLILLVIARHLDRRDQAARSGTLNPGLRAEGWALKSQKRSTPCLRPSQPLARQPCS